VRQQSEFAEAEAVWLMDDCPSYITQEVLGILPAGRVRIITFDPPTTHIFPVLDLTSKQTLRSRARESPGFQKR
jgi:hypothetical protein